MGEGVGRKRRNPVEDGPRLFKRGRWWAADLRPWGGKRPTLRDPKQPAHGPRTENKDTARRWAEQYVDRLRDATHRRERGIPPALTLEQAAEQFLDQRQSTKEYNTVKGNRTAVNHMLAAFGEGRKLHSITDEEIQAWFTKHSRRFTPNTLQSLRANVKGFFASVGRPVHSKLQIPKGHKDDPDALTDEELAALLAACETDEESAMVAIAVATGARSAELWALEAADFKPDLRSVRFQRQMAWPRSGTKGLKGKRNRTTLILPGFITASMLPASGRVLAPAASKDHGAYLFRSLLDRAGIYRRGRGIHCLRHTYGRLGMEKYKWSIEMLRVFLGHTSIKTTHVYAHFGEEAAIKLAQELTYR